MLAVLNGDGDVLEALTGSARSGTPVDLAQWRSASGLLVVLLGVGGAGRRRLTAWTDVALRALFWLEWYNTEIG